MKWYNNKNLIKKKIIIEKNNAEEIKLKNASFSIVAIYSTLDATYTFVK